MKRLLATLDFLVACYLVRRAVTRLTFSERETFWGWLRPRIDHGDGRVSILAWPDGLPMLGTDDVTRAWRMVRPAVDRCPMCHTADGHAGWCMRGLP